MLDEAARAHPESWWWIKADGADLVSGLGESVSGVWSGDVDLADGALVRARNLYDQRLHFMGELGKHNTDSTAIAQDLAKAERQICTDVEFISKCESRHCPMFSLQFVHS